MTSQVKTGFVLGTGTAINVELGWVPDYVQLTNVTDGDKIHVWHRQRMMAFTSGGTTEVVPGDVLQGATNTNVRAEVEQVFVTSGTWAGGDAAGFFLFREEQENGTFGAENVDLLDRSGASVKLGAGVEVANVATVTAQSELANFDIDTEVASVTPANGIQPYVGAEASNAKGFTITASASENTKLFAYVAVRQG